MTTLQPARNGFWRRFTPLFGLGLIGTAGIVPVLSRQLATLPTNLPLSPPALIAVALAQTAVLVAVATALGAALAPRLGLRSHLAERGVGGPHVLPALAGEAPLAVDLALRPLMPQEFLAAVQASVQASSSGLATLISGLLYGGIAEELLLRWGVMSLFAWVGWRIGQRGVGQPTTVVVWLAILGAALLFGLGHLPAAAALAPLTPAFVLRTVLLNSIFGIVAGWLFWRRSLEAAILAHMTVHVGFALARLLGGEV
ncbi:MAG: CPBP family intramembrane metalloprotease [Chloroflexi bacterium AL-W]|nr:CPBP family intramembrane metalloprotease [Chloroflexi bacterium AL-N1]NOK66434.1 CPBP family intramembrane metalloprotease [Chloroflexi bacterium AL-N10]NOK71822.1 CPBP family intramembrane metalloprotease [Chloroflexi bacterium AL-N5]NOK81079.1 CPBP family intramembrane metalloprotease [Chloroflexi bacterium AL-W]NOK89352.1 CPBP family intramembrane metalloprotease [Chloroflexi bacterium AL-N15]